MGKEASQITELALLKSVNLLILAGEQLRELFLINLEEIAESLANMPVEGQVRPVLCATLNDHVA